MRAELKLKKVTTSREVSMYGSSERTFPLLVLGRSKIKRKSKLSIVVTGGTAGGGVVGRRLGAVMNISIDLQQRSVYALF